MALRAVCPECGATTTLDDDSSKRSIACRQCGSNVPVPGGKSPAPPPIPKKSAPDTGFEVLDDEEDEDDGGRPAVRRRDDDEEDDRPSRSRSSRDDDDEEDDGGRPAVRRRDDDDDDDERPSRSRSSRDDDDDEDDRGRPAVRRRDDDDDEDDEPVRSRRSRDEDEEDDDDEPARPAARKRDDDEDDDEPARPAARRRDDDDEDDEPVRRKAVASDDDDEEEDEDEDDEPVRRKAVASDDDDEVEDEDEDDDEPIRRRHGVSRGDEDDDDEDSRRGGKSKKGLLIVAMLLLMLVGGGGGVAGYLYFMDKEETKVTKNKEEEKPPPEKPPEEKVEPKKEPPPFVPETGKKDPVVDPKPKDPMTKDPKVDPKPKDPEPKDPKVDPKPKDPKVDPKVPAVGNIAPGVKLVVEAGGKLPITPPEVKDGHVEVELPGPIKDACIAGGGRYLVFHCPVARKLVVFDVNTLKLEKTISLNSEDVLFAAGMEKLLVIYPEEKVIIRYSLLTLKKEDDIALEVRQRPTAASIGSGTAGPLLLGGVPSQNNASKMSITFLDLETMKEVLIEKTEGEFRVGFGTTSNMRISADGRTVGAWRAQLQPSGLQLARLDGNTIGGSYVHETVGHVTPGPDGQTIYTEKGMFNSKGEQAGRREPAVPAVHGNQFLTLVPAPKGPADAKRISIWEGGKDEPLKSFDDLPGFDGKADPFERNNPNLTLDRRLFLVPEAKLLIVVPPAANKLHVYRVEAAKK